MDEITLLDYLGYKNKVSTAEWAERLWQKHLNGAPQDFRPDADRQRYCLLLSRLEAARSLARQLHLRRTAHTPHFGHPAAVARY